MSETDQTFLEQRKFVRLDVERIGHPRCRMPIAPDLTLDLLLTDISPGGFGATVFVSQIRHFQKQREFQHCPRDMKQPAHHLAVFSIAPDCASGG